MAKRDREVDTAQPAGSSPENPRPFAFKEIMQGFGQVAADLLPTSRAEGTNICASALQLRFATTADAGDDLY